MGFSDRGYYREPSPSSMADWTAVLSIMVATTAVWLVNLLSTGDLGLDELLALHGDLPRHPLKFWGLLTYGFVHQPTDPWHLLGTLLMLWFFGREIESLVGRGEFWRFYCAAIVVAGLAWLASVQLLSGSARLLGADSAVMAVLAAFVWHFPKQSVLLMGVLPVPAWALGLLYLVVNLQSAADGERHMTYVAQLAGGLFGLCYAWRGWNFSGWQSFRDRLARRVRAARHGIRVVRPPEEGAVGDAADEPPLAETVDRLLEKISRSGEESLTPTERETLTRASRRLRERMR